MGPSAMSLPKSNVVAGVMKEGASSSNPRMDTAGCPGPGTCGHTEVSVAIRLSGTIRVLRRAGPEAAQYGTAGCPGPGTCEENESGSCPLASVSRLPGPRGRRVLGRGGPEAAQYGTAGCPGPGICGHTEVSVASLAQRHQYSAQARGARGSTVWHCRLPGPRDMRAHRGVRSQSAQWHHQSAHASWARGSTV